MAGRGRIGADPRAAQPRGDAGPGRPDRVEPPLWYALGWAAHRAGASISRCDSSPRCSAECSRRLSSAAPRGWYRLRFAAAAGLLVGVGAQFVSHGHELRAYELFALVTTLFALNLARPAASRTLASNGTLAGLVAAGLMTHYFFVFSVLAALVWLWLEPELRATRLGITIFVAGGAAICLPWLPYFVEQYRQDRYWWIGSFRLATVATTPFRLFTPLLTTGTAARVVPVLFLAVVAIGAVRLSHISLAGRLFATLALGPLILAGSVWASGEHTFASGT